MRKKPQQWTVSVDEKGAISIKEKARLKSRVNRDRGPLGKSPEGAFCKATE
jgi:hypothetical protein